MRLVELDPRFLNLLAPDGSWSWTNVSRAEADGIMFLCPKCFAANGGKIGTHVVVCWAPHVPVYISAGPGRWALEGVGFEDLSLRAGSSSILLASRCAAHFFVERGSIRMC